MPYSIAQNAKGRFVVTSPAGKTWKATYASEDAAQKGIDYIVKRSGGMKSSAGSETSEKTPGFSQGMV